MTGHGITLVHPGGPRNVRALAEALEAAGYLDRFETTLGWPTLPAALPAPLRQKLDRRGYRNIPWQRFGWSPWRELARQCLPLRQARESGWASTDALYAALDRAAARRLAAKPGRAVYCYDDGAAATFEAARLAGVLTIHELSAPYWRVLRRLSEDEALCNPEWRSALPALGHSQAKEARKDREIALADRIVVASRFAKGTLDNCPNLAASVDVVPYGGPSPRRSDRLKNGHRGDLRLLYVGNLNQQKGLSYLLEAVRRIGRGVTLTLLGRQPTLPCPPLALALRTHKYLRPVGHARVLEIMAEHDVLLFPTLFDGFGLVILEAMARGLAVIATPNCAAPDILSEGQDGLIVPIRDAEALATAIDRLATDPSLLREMRHAALRTAGEWSWERYSTRMVALVRSWLDDR